MNSIIGTLGRTRGELLRLLRRSALSVNELAAALGITDNAVRTHLAAMQRDGMVQPAGLERLTGGKPAQLFEITEQAEEMYPKAYAVVLGGMIQLLEERDGREAVVALLRALGARAGGAAKITAADTVTRVQAAGGALRQLGGDVEVVRTDGGWRIQGFGCPLSGVVGEHEELCKMVESLVAEISGQPVRECCDRSGRPRCAFAVEAGDAAGGAEVPGES